MSVEEFNEKTFKQLSKDVGNNIVEFYKEEVDNSGSNYQRFLRDGMTYDEFNNLVGSKVVYARSAEFGFPKGKWIPVTRLREWVKDNITQDPYEAEKITYDIRREIHDRGIPAKFFLLKSILRITVNNPL